MAEYGTSLANCTSGRCQANDIDIHFLRTGGDKPPLVALHGLIGSGACLSPVARTLKGDFDVILPDARGHGQSSGPVSGYSYPELAADVIGLIEKLALDQPILLGHSMGGLTAAVVALRTRGMRVSSTRRTLLGRLFRAGRPLTADALAG